MKINLNNPDQKREIDRIKILHWGHFSFVVFASILQIFEEFSGLWAIVKLGLLVFLYRLYFLTFKNFYYSFWMFSLLLVIYLFFGITQSLWSGQIASTYCYLLAGVLLGMEIFILNSPIYYPKVNWWEYDFRFRHDLKVEVISKSKKMKGRLIDLRGDTGCIVLFDDIEIGSFLFLTRGGDSSKKETLNIEVISRREEMVGRGGHYGVLFHFNSHEEKLLFDKLKKEWKREKYSKKRLKFKHLK